MTHDARNGSTMIKPVVRVIGAVTTCDSSDEHPYLRGYTVRIVAVLRGDDDDGEVIRDDQRLADLGGVEPGDRVEVQPWLAAEGRFSFVASDPLASGLAMFAHLGRSRG